jgi:inosine-uridine nucleoside N-ribohydrolase
LIATSRKSGGALAAIVLACALAGLGWADGPKRRSVVLTTDCGAEVDDQWALAHLALGDAWDLKGVVTTHAPNLRAPAAESAAQAARAVLGVLKRDATPVFAGSSLPLESGDRPRPNAGVDFLLEQARGRSPEDRLTVLVIGAATDVASALLVDPSWADRVELVAMAFDGWPDGGDVWNVKNDVRAWQVLLRSRAPIVVGDIRVTRKSLAMTAARAHTLGLDETPAGRFLVAMLTDWLARNAPLARRVTGADQTWPIWDEVTTAHLMGLTRTEARPRPRLRDDLTFDHRASEGTVEWVTAIDADRLWAALVHGLRRAAPR